MLRSFEERERAEELLFARSEETRFLNRRERIRAVADFAARKLGCDRMAADAYADLLIDAMVLGASDASILDRVAGDLAANLPDCDPAELDAALLSAVAERSRKAPLRA